jgi:hypothetical protein
MSNFVILRIQKLKAAVAVRRSLKHAFREQETPNADPARLSQNTNHGPRSVDEAMVRFHDRLPEKIRKNAVLAVEFLITASPEAMARRTRAEQDQYFTDALAWLRDRHGADNVVYAGIHRDETTPHLYAYVVPLDGHGKLNCRAFFGGAEALRAMQSDFADRVGKRHGLDRGIPGSRAKHTTVREYYAGIQRADTPMRSIKAAALEPRVIKQGEFLKRPVKESPDQVAERLTRAIHAEFKPLAVAAAGAAIERKKRKWAEDTVKRKEAELDAVRPLLDALQGLEQKELAVVLEQAQGIKRAAQVAAEAAKRAADLVIHARQTTSSAVVRWARWAVDAIERMGGDHRLVPWRETEKGWSDAAHAGWDGSALSRGTIMRTLADHSPGHAGLNAMDKKSAEAEDFSHSPRP